MGYKRILLTNDDGVYGPSLRMLARRLRVLGHVTVIVPDHERSTASHSLTLHKPLRFRELSKDFFILNGSPADCVRFGILYILRHKVDLVVSGINAGVNLGEDVIYSGTVAAAIEGLMLHVPGFAVSQPPGADEKQYAAATRFAVQLGRLVLKNGLPKDICLNVNVPALKKNGFRKIYGARVVHLGHRVYGKKITIRRDPRGSSYYWLLSKNVGGVPTPGSDVEAFEKGYITVTPLRLDWTAKEFMPELKKWAL